MDYSDPEIQKDLEELMQTLESTSFIDPTYSESWLRDLLDYVDRNKDYEEIDISNEANFVDVLNRVRKANSFTTKRVNKASMQEPFLLS